MALYIAFAFVAGTAFGILLSILAVRFDRRQDRLDAADLPGYTRRMDRAGEAYRRRDGGN